MFRQWRLTKARRRLMAAEEWYKLAGHTLSAQRREPFRRDVERAGALVRRLEGK